VGFWCATAHAARDHGRLQKLRGARKWVAAIDEAFANSAIHPKYEIQGVWAETRDLHDLRDPRGIEAAQSGSGFDVLEKCALKYKSLIARENTTERRGDRFEPLSLSHPSMRVTLRGVLRTVLDHRHGAACRGGNRKRRRAFYPAEETRIE
jgi:hypothetical protein